MKLDTGFVGRGLVVDFSEMKGRERGEREEKQRVTERHRETQRHKGKKRMVFS